MADLVNQDFLEISQFMDSLRTEKLPPESLRSQISTYSNEKKFELPSKKCFEVQYANIYFLRLCSIRERLKEKLNRLNLLSLYRKMGELPPNEESVIIGTLYKDMKLKPNVLQKLQNQTIISTFEPPVHYVSKEDQIFLEEEFGRVKLCLDENTGLLVEENSTPVPMTHEMIPTGVVAALLGTFKGEVFEVKTVFYPDFTIKHRQPPHPDVFKLQRDPSTGNTLSLGQYLTSPQSGNDQFMLLLSGLEVQGGDEKSLMELTLLKQFLFGNSSDQLLKKIPKNIVRMIIAGNSFPPRNIKTTQAVGSFRMVEKNQQNIENIKSTAQIIDEVLTDLSKNLEIDLMAGENDPCSAFFPQEPINRCYLPESSKLLNLSAVTNPYQFNLQDLVVLGTSGQNIRDIKRNTNIEEEIDILENLIRWNHIAPTCPDTLKTFPFTDNDPFFLNIAPNIFFSGNCSKFSTKMISRPEESSFIRLICVPKFNESGSVCLVNLKTLDTYEIKFSMEVDMN